jgi:tetratricopeptide (TPR) repeat protein
MKPTARFFAVSIVVVLASWTTVAQPVAVSSDSTISTLFGLGSLAFLQHNYTEAILYYQNILDREKEYPTLQTTYWYVLIDNLGMSYGISGNLNKAEEVFRYGISKEDTYPLFYYNLACTYAERDDMETTLKYLELAYKFKDNIIQGETFPDPMQDDSFQRFVHTSVFVDAVQAWKQK